MNRFLVATFCRTALAVSPCLLASNAAAQTAAPAVAAPAVAAPAVAAPAVAAPAVAAPAGAAPAATQPQGAAAEITIQKNKVSEGEDQVALAKSGRLLRYGVTAGAALAVHTPFASTNGVKVDSAVVSVTPYLGILPAYWGANEERATYCSTTGLFQDGEQARRAATAISRKTAKIELETMISLLKSAGFQGQATVDEAQIRTALGRFDRNAPPYDDDDVVYLVMAANSLGISDQAARELQQQEIVNVLAARHWRPELGSRCGWYRVGLWVGKPFGYSADVTIKGARGPTDVNPIISFGAIYMPNSYLTFMVGLTHNTVLDTTDVENKLHRGVWTLTTGIGGTLDIASLLTKG